MSAPVVHRYTIYYRCTIYFDKKRKSGKNYFILGILEIERLKRSQSLIRVHRAWNSENISHIIWYIIHEVISLSAKFLWECFITCCHMNWDRSFSAFANKRISHDVFLFRGIWSYYYVWTNARHFFEYHSNLNCV